MSYAEFSSIFLRFGTKETSDQKLGTPAPGSTTIDWFKPSTRSLIKSVLEISIANERNLDYLRELSKKVKNQMFDWVDTELKGFATLEDFGDLLSENGDFSITHRELAHLISRYDLR